MFTVHRVIYFIRQGFLGLKVLMTPALVCSGPLGLWASKWTEETKFFCLTSANSWNSLDIALKTKQEEQRQDSLMTRKHQSRAENRQICSVDSSHVTSAQLLDQIPAQTCSRTHPAGLQAYKVPIQKTSLTPFLIASIKTANAEENAHSSLEDVGPSWRPYLASFHPDEGKSPSFLTPLPQN